MPTFQIEEEELEAMPTWVISLPRSQDRRAVISAQLDAANITFWKFVDATDGRLPLNLEQVCAVWRSARRAPAAATDSCVCAAGAD